MKVCPLCGTPKASDVFVGMKATEMGPKFHCGSIFWPSQNRITVIGVACSILREMQRELMEAQAMCKHQEKFKHEANKRADKAKHQLDGLIKLPDCICFRDGISGPEFNKCNKRCRAFPDRNGDGTTKQDDIKFNRQWDAEKLRRTCSRCGEEVGELDPDGCRDPDCPMV